MTVKLQSLLRPSKNRMTDRAAFVQVIARLSEAQARRDRKKTEARAQDEQEAA